MIRLVKVIAGWPPDILQDKINEYMNMTVLQSDYTVKDMKFTSSLDQENGNMFHSVLIILQN